MALIPKLSSVLLSVALSAFPSIASSTQTAYYSYYHSEGGGIAEIIADADTGQIVSQRSVFNSPGNPMIEALTGSEGNDFWVAANRHKEARSTYMFRRDLHQTNLAAWRVDLPQRAIHHVVEGSQAAVLGHKGAIYRLDAKRPGTIASSLDLKRSLNIHDSSLKDAVFSPDGRLLLVLVAEDSPDGQRPGGRIVGLKWPSLTVAFSLDLPRDHPDLHYPIGSRERNPMPVAIRLLPQTNTAAIALNLYGAVAFTDLDALLEGKFNNYIALPTSKKRDFGTGFPTTLFPVEVQGRQLVLVDNSGEDGGMAVFDPSLRERLVWLDTGLTNIGCFQMLDGTRGAGNHSGILSRRGQDATITSHSEQNHLIVIDFQPLMKQQMPVASLREFQDFIYFSSPISATKPVSKLLLGLFAFDRTTLSCALYDLDTQRITDLQPSLGVIRGFLQP